MSKVPLTEAFAVALEHHRAGRLADAEALYRQILSAQPDHAEALHYFGVIAHQVGRHDLAIDLIRQALALHPDNPIAHSNLGEACRALNRLDEAAASFRRALQLQPDYPDAENNLGNVLRSQGQLDEAVAAYRRALSSRPDFTKAHYNLGIVFSEQGQGDEAIASYRRAIHYQPGYVEAHHHLGETLAEKGQWEEAGDVYRRLLQLRPGDAAIENDLGIVLLRQGRIDEAIAAFRRALELRPGLPEANYNLGNALRNCGRLDDAVAAYRLALALQPDSPETCNNLGIALRLQGHLDEAVASYGRALELKPGYPEAHNNLGIARKLQGRPGEALSAYRRALELNPNFLAVHNNLANLLKEQGQLDEAMAACRRALDIQPDDPDSRNNLGNVLKDRGELDEAVAAFRRAIARKPDFAEAHSNLIYTLHFLPGQGEKAIAAEQSRWNRRFSGPSRSLVRPHTHDCNPGRRLRIGYISPDFRDHVIGRNLAPLFRNHDHRDFETLCYSGVVLPDRLTEEMRLHVDRWQSILGIGDEALSEMIRHDGVDVLVDLTQHMGSNRLPVFARRPAPVQISFAGYPESTGVEAIGYRISDRYLESERGLRPATKEQVLLIDSFWCYDPCGANIEVNGLPARQSGRITFGSLNNFCKINETMLGVWARVLGDVPDSSLVLLSRLRQPPTAGSASFGTCGSRGASRGVCRTARTRGLPRALPSARHRPGSLSLQRPHDQSRCPLDGSAGHKSGRPARGFPGRTEPTLPPRSAGIRRFGRPHKRRLTKWCRSK